MANHNSSKQDPGNRCSLLVVEDNPGDVLLIKEALGELNFPLDLTVVGDGRSALDLLGLTGKSKQASLPDMILLDLNLPGVSGHEVLRIIKEDPRCRRILTVIFSSSGAGSDIRYCYQHQANCYLTKPGDLHQYLRVIRELFDFWMMTATRPFVSGWSGTD